MIIGQTESDILELVARFKFLTTSQLLPQLKKSTSYIRSKLAALKSKGLLASYNLEKAIKSENMYYLTEKGKIAVLENSKLFADDIRLVIGQPFFVRDYTHRKQTIEVQLALYNYLPTIGVGIIEYLCYFDKSGNNRKSGNLQSLTKVELQDGFFMPDSIMVTECNEETNVYMIEVFCDTLAQRPIQQLYTKHIPALAQGSLSVRYGIQKNSKVLAAFEKASIRDKVIERLKTDGKAEAFKHLLYFTTVSELKQNSSNSWKDTDNNILDFTLKT